MCNIGKTNSKCSVTLIVEVNIFILVFIVFNKIGWKLHFWKYFANIVFRKSEQYFSIRISFHFYFVVWVLKSCFNELSYASRFWILQNVHLTISTFKILLFNGFENVSRENFITGTCSFLEIMSNWSWASLHVFYLIMINILEAFVNFNADLKLSVS